MVKRTIIAALLASCGMGAAYADADSLDWLDASNVVWTSPSANSIQHRRQEDPTMAPRSQGSPTETIPSTA